MKKIAIVLLLFFVITGCGTSIRQSRQNTLNSAEKSWLYLKQDTENEISKYLEIPTRNYTGCEEVDIISTKLENLVVIALNQPYDPTKERHMFDMSFLYTKVFTEQVSWEALGCEETYMCHQTYSFIVKFTREFYRLTQLENGEGAWNEIQISWSSHKDGISCMVQEQSNKAQLEER